MVTEVYGAGCGSSDHTRPSDIRPGLGDFRPRGDKLCDQVYAPPPLWGTFRTLDIQRGCQLAPSEPCRQHVCGDECGDSSSTLQPFLAKTSALSCAFVVGAGVLASVPAGW